MILKTKKILMGSLVGVAVVGTSLAIAIPLALSKKNPESGKPKWNMPLPAIFYKAKLGGANAYTTDITKAQGYVAAANPSKATITPAARENKITIDGKEINATNEFKFDKKLPEGKFYHLKSSTSNEYTTDPTKAFDYKKEVKEVKPKIGSVTIRGANGGDTHNASKWTWTEETGSPARSGISAESPKIKGVVISKFRNETAYNPNGWTWKESRGGNPEIVAVQEVKPTVKGITIDASTGGESYDATKWTWKESRGGNPEIVAVQEVKPTVKGITIDASTGGESYDATKWTWTESREGNPATNAVQEVKPTVKGITIDASTGGESYDAAKWKWEQKVAPVAATNFKFYGIDLGVEANQRILEKGKPIASNVAILDALNEKGKITFDNSENKKMKFDGVLLEAVSGANNKGADYATILNTSHAKKNALNMILTSINSKQELAKYRNLDQITIAKAAKNGEWVPKYNGTEITEQSYKVTGAESSKPNDGEAPTGFTLEGDYVKGTTAVPSVAEVKDVYTASYNGTQISSITQDVGYTGTNKGAAPSGAPESFDDAKDYSKGTPDVQSKAEVKDVYTASYNGTQITSITKEVGYTGTNKGAAPTGAPESFDDAKDYSKGTPDVQSKAEVKDVYTPSYEGTTLTSYKQEVAYNGQRKGPKPTGAPTTFDQEDYYEGKNAVSAGVSTPDKYTPTYWGTTIPEYVLEVPYTDDGKTKGIGPSDGTPPTRFNPTNDYKKGTKGVDSQDPAVATLPAASLIGSGNNIEVDTTIYTVNETWGYNVNGQDAQHLDLYKKGSEYVTDITQADGYKEEVKPKKAKIENPKKNTTITIDSKTYTFK